ncbi:type III-B CRISPR-associated protein Cas10/Cmr2 [Azotobacter salinestris]|uniref:type III-B CRISPR-associated protein Cas10/Cmr2 n=1 Tax=Azotobacter salinestris TaxID=69964 RepID=UPI0032DF56F0
MPSKQTFQFTLGPVQGFVAQARRTRDFWAGSFILSWLSSVAMAAITAQRGEISFPVPDKDYLNWLHGNGDSPPPLQGSVPNRFKALTAEVPADFQPQLVTESVQAAWRALADCVWRNDLAEIADERTHTIWERQVENFWEISWVLSADEGANLLDRRKNWRNPVAPSEPGHKCMMMDGWQELSGVLVSNMNEVNQFWERLIASGKPGMQTDLRKGEQLCALAFIKRRFSRWFDQVQVPLPGGDQTIHGWRLPSAVPSVSFLAAAHWIAEAIEKAPLPAFEQFAAAARQLSSYSEAAHVGGDAFEIDILCVRDAARRRQQQEPGFRRLWAGLDGQLYFPTALQNPRLFDDQQGAGKVLKALKELRSAADMPGLPSPYYAILLMDGDQLGSHMGEKAKQGPISRALNNFTAQAGDLVRKHNGFLVYAGGDDVLALLPLEDALPAAADLQACYKGCFDNCDIDKEEVRVTSTLSAAIEFVHIRTPLTRVLRDAHRLLDDVAKDETGRDAVAVRVWKPSGLAAQWSMPWAKALDAKGEVLICQLAEQFARQQGSEEAHFSSKFFFRAEQLVERFPDMPDDALQQLLLAEYLHSFGSRSSKLKDEQLQDLKDSLALLNAQSTRWQRRLASDGSAHFSAHGHNPQAALLVRFLADKGMERDS